jgi:diketogulonate reductase-like aldo/keto reductase
MGKGATLLMEHDTITAVAKKNTKSKSLPQQPQLSAILTSIAAPAQVLLRWATQQGLAVIPKSNSQTRLAENLDCVEFTLDEADIKAISSLNQNLRVSSLTIADMYPLPTLLPCSSTTLLKSTVVSPFSLDRALGAELGAKNRR